MVMVVMVLYKYLLHGNADVLERLSLRLTFCIAPLEEACGVRQGFARREGSKAC
jgi:hypothetical protein